MCMYMFETEGDKRIISIYNQDNLKFEIEPIHPKGVNNEKTIFNFYLTHNFL
jgi:hypothetical protein